MPSSTDQRTWEALNAWKNDQSIVVLLFTSKGEFVKFEGRLAEVASSSLRVAGKGFALDIDVSLAFSFELLDSRASPFIVNRPLLYESFVQIRTAEYSCLLFAFNSPDAI